MTAIEALEFIKKKMSTDRAAAAYLGYTENYVNSFLCGRRNIPEKTALYIIMKAEQLKKRENADG